MPGMLIIIRYKQEPDLREKNIRKETGNGQNVLKISFLWNIFDVLQFTSRKILSNYELIYIKIVFTKLLTHCQIDLGNAWRLVHPIKCRCDYHGFNLWFLSFYLTISNNLKISYSKLKCLSCFVITRKTRNRETQIETGIENCGFFVSSPLVAMESNPTYP